MCPGILGKNGPVWKNYHLDGLLRVYRGGQPLLTLPPHRESRPAPDTRFADIVGSHSPMGLLPMRWSSYLAHRWRPARPIGGSESPNIARCDPEDGWRKPDHSIRP